MTNEQKQARDWMKSFGQDTPTSPTIPSLEVRKLRAKLILEEALETILALGFEIDYSYKDPDNWIEIKPNLTEILDGCEDLKVVTEGCLVACGLVDNTKLVRGNIVNEDPHFNEVMRSNFSKMWTQEEVNEFTKFEPSLNIEEFWVKGYKGIKVKTSDNERCWLVKDSSGKVIKSPSYSPATFKL